MLFFNINNKVKEPVLTCLLLETVRLAVNQCVYIC